MIEKFADFQLIVTLKMGSIQHPSNGYECWSFFWSFLVFFFKSYSEKKYSLCFNLIVGVLRFHHFVFKNQKIQLYMILHMY